MVYHGSMTPETRAPGITGMPAGQGKLSRQEAIRYSRHLVLPEVGVAGQERLKRGSVACVGAGGLGAPVALYLAAAGVGRIGLIDSDAVDISNLQRQVLYRTADVGRPKLDAARAALLGLNPEIQIVTHEARLSAENALELLGGYDVVVDGSDNFATRYLVNDACVKLGKPDVWASIYRWEGQVSVFDAARGPCYRCLFPRMPEAGTVPSCEEGGVFGVLPGVMGTLQGAEVIKLLLGVGEPLVGRLLVYDALGGRFDELLLGKDPSCAVCSPGSLVELRDEEAACAAPRPEEAEDDDGWTRSVEWLRDRLAAGNAPVLIDCRQPYEWDICRLDGSVLVPMAELPGGLAGFDRAAETVVLCHHGPRSFHAARYMRQAGFENVRFLDGGLDLWAQIVDLEMPRY